MKTDAVVKSNSKVTATTEIRKIVRRRRKVGEIVKPPTRAIRVHCLECCGWNAAEVARCTATGCWLWTYRFGGGAKADAEAAAEAETR